MKITQITVKGLLTKSKLPESAFCINPYVGCSHGCEYCYARFMKRFTGHDEPWGTFVDVKVNGAEVLAKELAKIRRPDVALLGSVTDAYQPLERRFGVTRNVLAVLAERDFPISILTKSDLVVRDMDLLRRFSRCSVGFSLMSLDPAVCRAMEPHASSPARRISAMRALHEAGIETYAFIGPIIPEITALGPIFTAVHGIADNVWAERLNTRCGNWVDVVDAVRRVRPELVERLAGLIKDDGYWDAIGIELRELSGAFRIPLVGYFQH